MDNYILNTINIKQPLKKEPKKYSIKDVTFDTSKYVETKTHIIKKIPLKL